MGQLVEGSNHEARQLCLFLLSSQMDRQYWVWRMELGISQNSILTPREYLALEPNTSIIMRPSV